MAMRLPCIRHFAVSSSSPLRVQRRWARVHDIRFVTHDARHIEDRYRRKLDEKAKREGLESVDELKEVYKDKIQTLRKSKVTSKSPWPEPPAPPTPTPAVEASTSTSKSSPIKTLSSFIDIPKVLELPQKDIEWYWRQQHAHDKNSLCAAIPTDGFSSILANARKHPQFIVPGLPRDEEGAPIHFLQWTFPGPDTVTVLFTHLAEYKLQGEYSQPHTTLSHHMELSGPKGLVLCQGSVVPDREVSVDEAKWLVMCVQKFYMDVKTESGMGLEMHKKRRQLMEHFSSGDAAFSIEELLDQADRVG